MKVAIQPLTWGNRPFSEICGEAAACGYEGIEAPVSRFLDNLNELKETLAAHKLECASSYCGTNLLDASKRSEEIRSIIKVAKALKELNCSQVILAAPGRQVPRERLHPVETMKEYSSQVNALCKAIQDETGVIAVFHNHIGTLVEKPEEIDWLMEFTDPNLLYGGFDTAHLSAGGGDPIEFFHKYANRIRYTHLKDRRYGTGRYGDFTEMGTGFIHFPTLIQILAGADYNGWLAVELDQTNTTPMGSAAVSREYLRAHCGL